MSRFELPFPAYSLSDATIVQASNEMVRRDGVNVATSETWIQAPLEENLAYLRDRNESRLAALAEAYAWLESESRDNNLSDTRIRYENNGVEGAWSIAGKIGQHTANEADFEIAFDDYWDLNIVVRMGGVEIKRFGVRDQSDDDNNVN